MPFVGLKRWHNVGYLLCNESKVVCPLVKWHDLKLSSQVQEMSTPYTLRLVSGMKKLEF